MTEAPNSNATLTGPLGLVVIPDKDTIDESRRFALSLLGGRADYCLSEKDLPHITLYHANLAALPRAWARDLLKQVQDLLCNKTFQLDVLGFAGGCFLFWDIRRSEDREQRLKQAHALALRMAEYLDRSIPVKAISEENLKLSPEEQSNAARFGHPLVNALYRPHITSDSARGSRAFGSFPRRVMSGVCGSLTCVWPASGFRGGLMSWWIWIFRHSNSTCVLAVLGDAWKFFQGFKS